MGWGRGGGGGGGGYINLTLHCRQQNEFCIQMGSDERYFNFPSMMMGDTAIRQFFHNRDF